MKTAEEIAFWAITNPNYKEVEEALEHQIKEYAKRKCKEQRKLCVKNSGINSYTNNNYTTNIYNSPEPEFD